MKIKEKLVVYGTLAVLGLTLSSNKVSAAEKLVTETTTVNLQSHKTDINNVNHFVEVQYSSPINTIKYPEEGGPSSLSGHYTDRPQIPPRWPYPIGFGGHR